jgi:hypothetical protein
MTAENLKFSITPRQHGVLHVALTLHVAQLKEDLRTTSDVSYAWSLLAQALEQARSTAKTLQLKVE